METIWNFFSDKPFFWGLGLGLIFCAVIAFFMWKSAFTIQRDLRKSVKRMEEEAKTLQSHLATQLKITAEGSGVLEKKLEEMAKQNENLRMNVNALQQKPGRLEARQLQVMEVAVGRMRERVPGFAPAWEQALKEADGELTAAEGGFSKLMRKVIPGMGTRVAISDAEEKS